MTLDEKRIKFAEWSGGIVGRRKINFMCDCIKNVDIGLEKDGIQLKLHPTVNLNTGEMGFDLAIETYAIRKGAKKKLIRPIFCPFCGMSIATKQPTPETGEKV